MFVPNGVTEVEKIVNGKKTLYIYRRPAPAGTISLDDLNRVIQENIFYGHQLVLLYPITSVVEIAMVPSGYVVSSGRNELVRCVAVGESHCDIYGGGDRIAEPYAATRR
jgi:hypothetical protein